jgi:hypothetical protein
MNEPKFRVKVLKLEFVATKRYGVEIMATKIYVFW